MNIISEDFHRKVYIFIYIFCSRYLDLILEIDDEILIQSLDCSTFYFNLSVWEREGKETVWNNYVGLKNFKIVI